MNFEITINGVDYSQYVSYPVSITDKSREESLSVGKIKLVSLAAEKPFKPHQQLKITFKEKSTIKKEWFMLLLNDVTIKEGFNDSYLHELNFVEYIQVLENVILPNFTITRIEGLYEPTLGDVVSRIRSLISEVSGVSYTLNVSELDEYPSPEWTFNGFTALEALRMVFSMAHSIPVFEDFSTIGMVKITENITEGLINFAHSQESYDPETYRSALYSNVENMVSGEEETITEPANG